VLTRHPHRTSVVPVVLSAVLAAVVMFTVGAVASPSTALGASTFSVRCDVSVRTKPWSSSTRKAVLPKGAQVYAVTKVSGGYWRTACGGGNSGTSWYRISVIKGTSVASRYGVTYVYAPTAFFTKSTLTTRFAACDGVAVRTYPSTAATRKALLPAGTVIQSVATVSGGSWSTNCAGSKSGSSWYRIGYVSGQSAKSRYGVVYVYAATGTMSATKPSTSTSPTPTPTPTPSSGPTLTEGIDVSHWQGAIDWSKVRASGKRFAYIKASESTSFVDDQYATNRSRAKAAGMLVGAYHFARPGTNTGDAAAEADHFIRTAAPVKGELLPVLDLEVTGGLSDAQLATWAKDFLDRVYEKTGVKGAIYVSPAFWRNSAGDSRILWSNGYKVLWIAHWTTASSPSLPADNWGGYGWTFWQYTSDGSVSGISGRVDLNRYKGTDFAKVLIP
jgi:GH25 family lysozyme M1 (1,4-beta-N-acetylmuramidase)